MGKVSTRERRSPAVLTRRQLLRGQVDPLTMTAWQNLVGPLAVRQATRTRAP